MQLEIRQPAPVAVSAALHLPSGPTSCPPASPLSPASCRGRHSSCWSVGVSDLDCPGWGLCCFDGCANTCVGTAPPPPPPPAADPIPSYGPPPQPRVTPPPPAPRNPCDPNPCGPGAMCIPQVRNTKEIIKVLVKNYIENGQLSLHVFFSIQYSCTCSRVSQYVSNI